MLAANARGIFSPTMQQCSLSMKGFKASKCIYFLPLEKNIVTVAYRQLNLFSKCILLNSGWHRYRSHLASFLMKQLASKNFNQQRSKKSQRSFSKVNVLGCEYPLAYELLFIVVKNILTVSSVSEQSQARSTEQGNATILTGDSICSPFKLQPA